MKADQAQVDYLRRELAHTQQGTGAATEEKTIAPACFKNHQANVEKLEQHVVPHVAVSVWEKLDHCLEAVEKGISLYRDPRDLNDT